MVIAMIRVLQVLPSTKIGGAENLAVTIGENVDKEEFSVDYLVFEDYDTFLSNRIKKIGKLFATTTTPRKNLLKFSREISILFKEQKYDVVHTHCGYLNWIILREAKKSKIKTIICHSHTSSTKSFAGKFFLLLTRIYSKKGTIRIACSNNAGKFMFGKKDFIFFHNGINISEYNVDIDDFNNRFKNQYGINNKKIIVHIGRFEEMKNHIFLIINCMFSGLHR